MDYEYQKLLLNQVRQRILQYVLKNGAVTVKEIIEAMPDIPQATMYRQVKALLSKDLLLVSAQKLVRGTLEHTYILNPDLVNSSDESRTALNIQFTLLSIAQDFADNYEQKRQDEDTYRLISEPLFMSDDEYETYMSKVENLTRQYLGRKPGDGLKSRRLTLISTPI